MIFTILSVCARVTGHPQQYNLLKDYCAAFNRWDDLVIHAEAQGMGPLLYHHICAIDLKIPDAIRRILRILYLRHQQKNRILIKVLRNVIDLLENEGINALVLKGAALCNTLYPEPGLRPMRDVDIMVSIKNAQRAQKVMIANGFAASREPIPSDHFHLPELHQTIDNVPVCLELHRSLLPDCPPYYRQLRFNDLQRSALCFDLGGKTAYSLGHVEMLWHLYQHGFRMPLTYEQYKLITVADIVSLIEEKTEEIDWDKIKLKYPELLKILPLFHYLTPWQERIRDKLSIEKNRPPRGVGMRFRGWPQVRLSEEKNKGILKILYDTFFPPQWWFKMYYSPTGLISWYYTRFIKHPFHIFWWVKLYWS
ncbi:MAG: nucleotidyltransferase family protein, partial [Desulfobacterales bacterium]